MGVVPLMPGVEMDLDRAWNLVEANSALSLFTDLLAPHLLAPPINVLRAGLHPDGLARHIVNLGE